MTPIDYLVHVVGSDELEGMVDDLLGLGGNVSALWTMIDKSLKADKPVELTLIASQAYQWLRTQIAARDEKDMDELGHEEDPLNDAPEQPLEPEHVDVSYWSKTDPTWLQEYFKGLDVSKQIQSVGGIELLRAVYDEWYKGGVKTRSQILKMGGELYKQWKSGSTQQINLKRGPGPSGPKSYATSVSGQFTGVTYTKNGDGYFDFGHPTGSTTWKDPSKDGPVDLEDGSTKAGWGIMKNNKTIVPLKKASRSQHFSIANRIAGISGSGSPANYTWHHLETPFQMILIDRTVHRKHGHNGGVYLWK